MKKIAITMGDPAGVGPEVVIKALSAPDLRGHVPVVIGDRLVIREAIEAFRSSLELKVVAGVEEAFPSAGTLWLMDTGSPTSFRKNRPDGQNGIACANYVKKAVELAMEKRVDAVVTAPVSKEALKLGGLPWPGHTEMLAELTGTVEYAMMLVGGPLRVILVTIHTALRNVPVLVTKERVLKVIRLAKRASDMLGIDSPRIAVAGLNPHAGESGLFGDEEEREIIPAIESARSEGIAVEGPYPADTIFHKAFQGALDMVVCMYHDQGLIPLKMIAFDKGVNITVGLPIIRTSPDHGTAYDIAWKGVANPSSMIEAIRMALKLRM